MRYIAIFIVGLIGFHGTAFSATLSCAEPGDLEVGSSIMTGFEIFADTSDYSVLITLHYKEKSDPNKKSELIVRYKNGASGNISISYTADGVVVPGIHDIKNNQLVTIRRDFLGWGSDGRYVNTFDKKSIELFCHWSE